jgi:hypothetical protein
MLVSKVEEKQTAAFFFLGLKLATRLDLKKEKEEKKSRLGREAVHLFSP